MATARDLPLPPLDMANRVGSLEAAQDPYDYYDELGRRAREHIVAALPDGWSFDGKRVLDFGAGAGRTLRHFAAEAGRAEFWGCDIHAESVAWMADRLSPPFHVFTNGETPPLDRPDGYFDLIWCVSVFTHLTDTWSAWLLELHRVLAPGGLLVSTFMGEGMSRLIAAEPWQEDRVGMLVLRPGQSWDLGGPMVMHSPWWLREHWGRLFEVVSISPSGFCTDPGEGHGTIVVRKDERAAVSAEELERPREDEPRETRALAHNVDHLVREAAELRVTVEYLEGQLATERASRETAEQARAAVEGSRSYRATAPLRRIATAARRSRG